MSIYKYSNDKIVYFSIDGLNFIGCCGLDSKEYLEWLSQGNMPVPADPVPNPAIATIDAKLADIDFRSIRPIREGDTVFLANLTAQVIELRAARALLPTMV